MKNYFWNFLVGIDQLANVIFSPILNMILGSSTHHFGDPGETLSSVMGKNIRDGNCKGCKLVCKVLNFLQTNHCVKSIEDDEGKDQL